MLGFACKINTSHDKALDGCNTKTTTITWLRNNPSKSDQKLQDLLVHNMQALKEQLAFVAKRPEHLRMFRISSDILPAYTHDEYMPFYFSANTVAYLEKHLAYCGEFARKHKIRLSFHPGQFCVLASDNPGIVENSIVEFEYHADVIRYMGYGRTFQDFKCNVHIGGKQGPDGIKRAFKRLSREAQNTLTIENAEFSWGIDHSLELVDTCALVLDVHHDWIHSDRYIGANSDIIKRVQDSWRGVKPVIHYSQSRALEEFDAQELSLPKETGYSKMALRAHSDYYYNRNLNELVRQHYAWADIMLEAKQKNLAVDKLASEWGL
jgi:UV damage endonuclease UvdE